MHVLGKIVGIVKVDHAVVVGFHDVMGEQETAGDVLGHFAGHVVTLNGVDQGILVGVFLFDFLVVALQQRHDLLVGRVGLAHQGSFIAVGDVVFGHGVETLLHNGGFHHILDFFHTSGTVQVFTLFGHLLSGFQNGLFGHLVVGCGLIGFADRIFNLAYIENDFFSASFDYFHLVPLLSVNPSDFSREGLNRYLVKTFLSKKRTDSPFRMKSQAEICLG